MDSSARVVTRENALEMHNSITVARLDAAEEGIVGIFSIVRVAVSICHYTGVDAL